MRLQETVAWLSNPTDLPDGVAPPGLDGWDPSTFLQSAIPIAFAVSGVNGLHELGHRVAASIRNVHTYLLTCASAIAGLLHARAPSDTLGIFFAAHLHIFVRARVIMHFLFVHPLMVAEADGYRAAVFPASIAGDNLTRHIAQSTAGQPFRDGAPQNCITLLQLSDMWSQVKLGPSFFIPNGQLGSFGAVTPFRSMVRTRRDLFDVAAAGPVSAGVASAVLFGVGLVLSSSPDQVTLCCRLYPNVGPWLHSAVMTLTESCPVVFRIGCLSSDIL